MTSDSEDTACAELEQAIVKNDLDGVKNFCGQGEICLIRRGYECETALHKAVRMKRHSIVRHMLDLYMVDVNSEKAFRITCLHLAVENNDIKMVQTLCAEEGLDINARGGQLKETPLHWATMYKHHAIVEYLLSQPEIEVNAVTPQGGYTPLYWAVRNKDLQSVKALCSHQKIEPNQRFGQLEETPLHLAVRSNCLETVKILCSTPGIDVNAEDSTVLCLGKTPLRLATDLDNYDIMCFLCRLPGIRLDIEDPEGRKAMVLRRAVEKNDVETVKYLCSEKLKDMDITSVKRMEAGALESLIDLANRECDPEIRDILSAIEIP